MAGNNRYTFDDVVIDARNYRVYKAGELRPIGPRAFDLLLDLMTHRGRVVSKQELFDRVWQGVAVTDNALTRAIKDLRRAIGDRARAPRYIETAARRGYRFVADVSERPADTAVSLLVLPFDDLSAEPSTHLTDGLVDELIARLGRLNPDRLTVIGHASAVVAARTVDRPWVEIGRDLDVAYVVRGTVRRDAERVQASITLGRVADGHVVSTRTVDASVAETAGFDTQLADAIAREVQVALTEGPAAPPERPVDPEAYAALLEGRHFLRQRTADATAKARAAFERAVARAPSFARAYVGLAQCHVYRLMLMEPHGHGADIRTDAMRAITRALELDDRLAEAHAVRAVLQCAAWEFEEAERSLRWAIALDPADPQARHWLAMFSLVTAGRYGDALEELQGARRLDPLSLIIVADLASVHLMMRQFDQAVSVSTECLHLDPHFARAHLYLGMARAAMGRLDTAVVAFETAARLDSSPWIRAWLGYAYGAAGRAAEARTILASLEQQADAGHAESLFLVGVVYSGLGDAERAVTWFTRAMEARAFWVMSLAAFPAFDGLRRDAAFVTLLGRIRDTAWPGSDHAA